MKMRKFLIINILYLIFATSSFAQAKNKFEGFYLGVDAGRAIIKDHGYEDSPPDGPFGQYLNKNNLSGNLYGYHLGYNFSLDNIIGLKNFVFSTQFEFKKGINLKNDWSKQIDTTTGMPSTECNYCTKTTFNESHSLIGKFGYLINEKNLINIVAGLTDLRVKREVLYDVVADPPIIRAQVTDKINSVPIYGVGFERIINNNLSFIIDTRHLESKTLKSSYTNSFNQNEYFKYKQKSLTAGINYRF